MTRHARTILAMTLLAVASLAAGQEPTSQPKLFVPYKDLAAAMSPDQQTVLMERAAFEKLLAEAQANARGRSSIELGQITKADYQASVAGSKLTLAGKLTLVSMSDKPVPIPLGFAQIGLTQLSLDDKPAPLGYDAQGRLVLIVSARGEHTLSLAGSANLTELPGGGMQFGLVLPEATAGSLKLAVPGDIGVHATVPVADSTYDKAADRTTAVLTLGGQSSLTVVLMGNGRQEDDKPLLLGESSASVAISPTQQTLNALYTVQVLRRGVRDLEFTLDQGWTITDVACPNLVKWSVTPGQGDSPQKLTVHLRSASQGSQALTIQAIAPRSGQAQWTSPRLSLVGAAFQRGYLMVDAGDQLRVRGEKLVDARREDVSVAAAVAKLLAAPGGRMYYHWGDRWSVQLELVRQELRIASTERQLLAVKPEELQLIGQFQITAIGRELYEVAFALPPAADGWELSGVNAPGKFEYRVSESAGTRTLHVELAKAIPPEGVADISIVLRHVPTDWDWTVASAPCEIQMPLIRTLLPAGATTQKATDAKDSLAQTVSGLVAVSSSGDLESTPLQAAERLRPVTIGRMAALGLGQEYQHAWSYEGPVAGKISLRVVRAQPRISAGSVGLVSVQPSQLSGDWSLTYDITRASTRTLYLLADKSLGQEIKIETPGRRLVGRKIVTPTASQPTTSGPTDKGIPSAAGYDTWMLTLDSQAQGQVVVQVHYDRPLPSGQFNVPLIRPAGLAQSSELLAIQASEELALDIKTSHISEVDAIDLPPLPAPSRRILAAGRLDSPASAVQLGTTMHQAYGVAPAIAVSANLNTNLGSGGVQDTEATFQIVNAGLQFLNIRLPAGAELWSVSAAGQQAKPKRGAGDDYLISLPRSQSPQAVRVVYRCVEKSATAGKATLGAPTLLDVKVNSVTWNVAPPPGYRVASSDGRARTDTPVPLWRDSLSLLAGLSEGSRLVRSTELTKQAGAPKSAAEPCVESEDQAARTKLDTPEASEKPGPRFRYETTRPASQPPGSPDRLTLPPQYQYQATGRYTLPVALVAAPGGGQVVRFESLGLQSPQVTLTAEERTSSWRWVGLLAGGIFGLAMIRARAARKFMLIALLIALSVLLTVWWPAITPLADGLFLAAVLLVPFYLVVGLLRWTAAGVRKYSAARVGKAVVAALVICLLTAAQAQGQTPAPTATSRPAMPSVDPAACMFSPFASPIVVPYTGDPSKADQATQVLIPYSQFAELWNLANPSQPIDGPTAPAGVSLAGATYQAVLSGEQLKITLTADLKTYGKGWLMQPMPIAGMAVTDASINGKPAQLQVGPKGMVLAIQAPLEGKLTITGVATPKILGRRGSIDLSLPPLPAAVMKVTLPEADLDLDVPKIEGAISSKQSDGGIEFTVPLGSLREVSLRWSPKTGSAGDKTLSAEALHNVHVFHWGLVASSKITFTFSAGEHERFLLLAPKDITLTDITGANLRDYRVVGEQTVEGEKLNVVEVRLHRSTTKAYALTATWIASLPALDKPFKLPLPQAWEVGRESGAVAISTAGGMTAKVTDVTGGRREAQSAPAPADTVSADATTPVARYYWPYRPFSLSLQLARQTAQPQAAIDQLVRVNTEDVQLLAQVNLSSDTGRLFGASFSLPEGYEVLSALGAEVGEWYVQPSTATTTAASQPAGKRLHVAFRAGLTRTKLAVVMVRKDAKLDKLSIPTMALIDDDGKPVAKQTGRLAVQVAPALSAQTVSSANLTAIAPAQTAGWLDPQQIAAVQFAYSYERPDISLQLAVARKPSLVRVDVFAGLTVEPTSAWFTYRLRYTVEGSPIDRVSFTLPAEYAPLVEVACPQMRSLSESDQPGGLKKWTVALANELTGVLDVSVNLAQPIDASTTRLTVPHIATEAPGGYQLALAVQNMSRHELAVEKSAGLAAMPPSDQRKLLDEEVRKSLQYVFAASAQDWSLGLKVTPAKQAQRIQAVIDLMSIATTIDRDGQCRYEVTLSLQNRSEQFLKVQLPKQLELWSAGVAGEPVKPVVEAGAKGTLLIPLVKTSPGGLPYDVKLYLAGKLDQPLKDMTRLDLPKVGISGIDVVRTAWSLRLPEGYRYSRPEGNMSEAGASIAGAAELMSVGIDARLDQLKRLASAGENYSGSGRGKKVADRNWDVYNRQVAGEIAQAEQYLSDNKASLEPNKLKDLQSKIAEQKSFQGGLMEQYKQNEQIFKGNVNDFINSGANAGGFSESSRNSALTTIPSFIQEAGKEQREKLGKELEANLKEENFANVAKNYSDAQKNLAPRSPGLTRSGDLLEKDKSEDVSGLLKNLEDEKNRQVAKRQDDLSKQLDELRDNRLGRFYTPNANPTPQPNGVLNGDGTIVWSGEGDGRRSGQGSSFGPGGSAGGGGRPATAPATGRPGGAADMPPASPEPGGFDDQGWTQKQGQGPDAGGYVSKGTYSLPVELPAGAVQLSYVRPGGDATLSVLAVKDRVYSRTYGTIGAVVLLLLALALARLAPRAKAMTARAGRLAILVYVALLAAILLLGGGVLGLVFWFVVVLAAEIIRRALRPRTN